MAGTTRLTNTTRCQERVMSESHSTETWRPVVGYEGFYEVSDRGRIRGVDRLVGSKIPGTLKPWKGKILAPGVTETGRLRIRLMKYGKSKMEFVHRLVLLAFVGPCPEGMEACHDPDPDPSNCRLNNLRWDTHIANKVDQMRHGRGTSGERHGMAKLTTVQVEVIRREYRRTHYHRSNAKELAARYGVTVDMVGRILRGDNWRKT